MTGLAPSAEQRGIVEAVAGPIADILPLARLHRPASDAPGADEHARLGRLAELGCLGVGLDEACGGTGLGAVEEALVFEQLGRRLASPAVFATVLAAHVAQANGDHATASAVAAGERAIDLAIPMGDGEGEVLLLGAGGRADPVLRLDPDGATLVQPNDLSDRRRLDDSQWGLALERAACHAPAGRPDPALALRAKLLLAAQLAGIAGATRDMAVDYAKIREQFGRPIGSFQAVKHHCADMAMAAMAAADLMGFAAIALSQDRPDAAFQVSAALSVAIRAAKANAALNVQVHGGMGFSDECDAHLFVKRAHVLETIAGGGEAVHAALLAEPSPMGPPLRTAH